MAVDDTSPQHRAETPGPRTRPQRILMWEGAAIDAAAFELTER